MVHRALATLLPAGIVMTSTAANKWILPLERAIRKEIDALSTPR